MFDLTSPRRPVIRDLALLVLLALAIRLACFVGMGFNDDATYTGYAALLHQGYDFHPVRGYMGTRLAVLFPIVASWHLFGVGPVSTALYFLACGVGAVAAVYLLARRLFGVVPARLAGLLMCVFPINVVTATQYGADVPMHFWSLILVCLLVTLPADRFNDGGRRRYVLQAAAAGIALGLAYLTKSSYVLLFPVMLLVAVFGRSAGDRPNTADGAVRRYAVFTAAFIAGLLCVVVPAQLYFTGVTGEWFAIEKYRYYATTHDRNIDVDFMRYPAAMLNLSKGRWESAHDIPAFGFMYYGLVIALAAIAGDRRRIRQTAFLCLWAGGIFFFYQYFLYFYATHISPVGHPRQVRYLIMMSGPVCILMGYGFWQGFFENRMSWRRLAGVLAVAGLVATSTGYAYAGASFLRNGMAKVRETAAFLETIAGKTIYLPDSWSRSKFYFFAGYDFPAYKGRLKTYRLSDPAQRDLAESSGRDIRDAYVVVNLSPYSYGSRDQYYPRFCVSPPKDWQLVKEIHIPNRGLFGAYHPKIYYAP